MKFSANLLLVRPLFAGEHPEAMQEASSGKSQSYLTCISLILLSLIYNYLRIELSLNAGEISNQTSSSNYHIERKVVVANPILSSNTFLLSNSR